MLINQVVQFLMGKRSDRVGFGAHFDHAVGFLIIGGWPAPHDHWLKVRHQFRTGRFPGQHIVLEFRIRGIVPVLRVKRCGPDDRRESHGALRMFATNVSDHDVQPTFGSVDTAVDEGHMFRPFRPRGEFYIGEPPIAKAFGRLRPALVERLNVPGHALGFGEFLKGRNTHG